MIQSLFILSPVGEVLVERHFRSILTSRTVCDIFWTRASESLNHHGGVSTVGSNPFPLYDSVPPVMEVPDVSTGGGGANAGGGGSIYLFHVLRHGLTYLAACPPCIGGGHFEVPPLLVIEFLHKIADTFVIYFGDPADESAVKDNFSTAYQLLEEMVDHGWPLTTEPNALTDLIRPPTVLAKVSTRRIRVDHHAVSFYVHLKANNSKWIIDPTSHDRRIIFHPIRCPAQGHSIQHAMAQSWSDASE